jgi:dienelactone hydrolase
MKKTVVTVSLLAVGLSSFAQDAPPESPRASLAIPADAPPPKSTPPGPYEVVVEANEGLPTHTIYRPADLTKFGGDNRLPIVSWGNGACANVGMLFQEFLKQIASHGYVAISIGPKEAPLPAFARGAGGLEPAASEPAAIPPPQSRDEQLLDAIDWALKENAREGSPYYGRLNPERIAVMGQSCGGLQTIAVSSDPRITTSVLWNSGTFAEGSNPMAMRLSKAKKSDLAKLHAPVAYFIGGPSDIAYPQAEDDFKHINVPVFKGNLNVGHGGTFRHPGAGWFGEVGVAWLDWQLKGDAQAAKYFVGEDCILCTNPSWRVEKKGID